MTDHTDLIKRLRDGGQPRLHLIPYAADALAAQAKRIAELEAAAPHIRALEDILRFVERWANHHATKPTCTAEAALSVIQHYPPIKAITLSYADGKVPETPDPWTERDAALARVKRLEDALRGLLVDTQHLNHECCEEDCPVAYARAALAEGDNP